MKCALYYIKGKGEPWAEEACQVYLKKLNGFLPFESKPIKAKQSDRDNAVDKKQAESKYFLNEIEPSDLLILFDESGRQFKNSREFSQNFIKILGRQSRRIVFGIGGAYGFSDEARTRAQEIWSLSHLTMNHHLAHVVALEQIYRALTIWKNIPYHND